VIYASLRFASVGIVCHCGAGLRRLFAILFSGASSMRRSHFWCSFSALGLLLVSGCQNSADSGARSAPPPASEKMARAPMASPEPGNFRDAEASPVTDGTSTSEAHAEGAAGEGSGSSAGAPTSPTPTGDSAPTAEAALAESPDATPPTELEAPPTKARDEEAIARKKQEIQSGLLTAGSFDDVEKFSSYQEFLTNTLQQDADERFPRWAIGERVTIRVQSEQGESVSNARVEIRAVSTEDEQQQAVAAGPVLATLITGSDGRVLLLTGEDKVAGRNKLAVRVVVAGVDPVDQILEVRNPVWDIRVSGAKSELPQQLDLALVIDTTGSMDDELDYLKAEIDSIATTVKEMFPNVDQRFALVLYRDAGDQYVSRTFDFTSSLADFRSTLSAQTAGGGGDYPEAMHLAMEHAKDLSWRKDNTARVMFLVGDAPPHQQYARRTLEAGLALREQGIRIYPLGASGVALEAEFIMRAMALASVGQYLFLTDHSGIGNAHAMPHVPEFLVERLDRMMIRMIASELAGKRLVPTEVIAIERRDAIDRESLPPEPQQQPAQVRQTSYTAPAATPTTSTPWVLADITRWALFGGLILGVFLLDAWDKHRQR
jgi:hypothetical protein